MFPLEKYKTDVRLDLLITSFITTNNENKIINRKKEKKKGAADFNIGCPTLVS